MAHLILLAESSDRSQPAGNTAAAKLGTSFAGHLRIGDDVQDLWPLGLLRMVWICWILKSHQAEHAYTQRRHGHSKLGQALCTLRYARLTALKGGQLLCGEPETGAVDTLKIDSCQQIEGSFSAKEGRLSQARDLMLSPCALSYPPPLAPESL